jgi:prepilin-type N-terminal cleavage/methylation domain-containing protein
MAVQLNPGSVAHRRGFTLIELVLALALLSVVLLGVTEISSGTSDAYTESSTRSDCEHRAQRALIEVATVLQSCGTDQLLDDPVGELGLSTLDFDLPTAFSDGELDWTQHLRLELQLEPGETDDGTDEDGDGLIDERQLVLIRGVGGPAPRSKVLASGVLELGEGEIANLVDDDGDGTVDEPGFCVRREDRSLLLQLTLGGRVRNGEPFACSVATAITLRN